MSLKIEDLDPKFAHFNQFEGSFLAILVVEKVVFWTFKVVLEFRKCLGIVFGLNRQPFGCIFNSKFI